MSVQIRNPELIRLLAADFATRRELVTTPGNRVTLTNTDLSVSGGGALTLSAAGAYTLTIPETGTAVLVAATQTLTNKTLTTPTIGDFTNATHNHTNAAGGGQLALTTAVTGILPPANGGTGVNNDTRTLTINTNSGTLAFSGASYTLTIPSTGTAALLGTANTFTATQLVVVDQGNAEFQAFTYRDTPSAGFFRANKARGTLAAPTVLQNGDLIGGFIGNGYTGTVFLASAQISLVADGAMGSSRIPGRVELLTSDGIAGATTRMTIKSNGNVGINTTSPSAQLHVDQLSATGAKPTLRLRQADLSEEFIRFEATVGAGNPINTTALGTYYGRVRVYVEGVGEKWLALYNT